MLRWMAISNIQKILGVMRKMSQNLLIKMNKILKKKAQKTHNLNKQKKLFLAKNH